MTDNFTVGPNNPLQNDQLAKISRIVAEVYHIADGVRGALGTEYADRVTKNEAALANAIEKIREVLLGYR